MSTVGARPHPVMDKPIAALRRRRQRFRAGRDGLRGAGGRYFIGAIKKRGTKAGHSFDDPASHREPPSWEDGTSLGTRAAPCGALSKDIGRVPVPAKFGKATQRPAVRDRLLRERAGPVFQDLRGRFGA